MCCLVEVGGSGMVGRIWLGVVNVVIRVWVVGVSVCGGREVDGFFMCVRV